MLARQRGLRIGVVTKSTLIERDIPLLQRIAQNNTLVLHLTITTPERSLGSAAGTACAPARSAAADGRPASPGRAETGILCSPLLPGITDTGKALDGMARRAKAADASFFSAQPLFLKPCSKEIYLAFIREHFPASSLCTGSVSTARPSSPAAYRKRIEALVKAVCAKHGLGRRNGDALLTREEGRRPLDWPGSDSGLFAFPGGEAVPG